MLIAIMVLFALYITTKQKETSNTRIIPRKMKSNREMPRNIDPMESSAFRVDPKKFQCPHHFGFLKTRRNKDIPEECAGCKRLVDCMLSRE